MSDLNPRRLPTRFVVLKRIGYALVSLGLIVWLLLTSTPQLAVPRLVAAIWILIGAGVVLIAVNKGVESIQQYGLRKRRAMCLTCGWFGDGLEWFRGEACPECDSREVALQ